MLYLLLAIFFNLSFAQDVARDLDFFATQNTQSTPFNVPAYIDSFGNLNLIAANQQSAINVSLLGHIGWGRSTSLYGEPIKASEFTLSDPVRHGKWIEVKRYRWELGIGIEALLAQTVVSVGIAPYKGARQIMLRHKKDRDEKTPRPKLPEKLHEISSWQIGDKGSFQQYGGVQVYAGVGVSAVNVVTASLILQNLYSFMIEKKSEHLVEISLTEEDLTKRKLQSGLVVASARLHFLQGKRLSTLFVLDLRQPEHHQLYREALKGRLTLLQDKLPEKARSVKWEGIEKVGYVGIPGVAGKYFQRSEFDMSFDGEDELIDIKSRNNSGILLPVRNHNKIVYQTGDAINLIWYSEVNRAPRKLLKEKFLEPGQIMGARGFTRELPEIKRIGAAQMQLGIEFTRKELEQVTPGILEDILDHYYSRCVELELTCSKRSHFKQVAKKLRQWLDNKWTEIRDNLGFLMIEEPALIYAYEKTLQNGKKLNFRFLSEKFQSLEGESPLQTN